MFEKPGFLRNIYWKLPYKFRRKIFSMVYPDIFKQYQILRNKPFIDNFRNIPLLIQNRCIFIHIPKTAGIAITKSLFGSQTGGHTSLSQYSIILKKEEFNTFFKFAFVRNPWDRLLSAFLYLKQGGRNIYDREWSKKHLSFHDNFKDFVINWVNANNIMKGIHFLPQYKFITLPGKHKPSVDFLGRYENLPEDYNHVRSILGFGKQLKKENMTTRVKGYRHYYNDTMVEIVYNAYKKDIILFDYTFD